LTGLVGVFNSDDGASAKSSVLRGSQAFAPSFSWALGHLGSVKTQLSNCFCLGFVVGPSCWPRRRFEGTDSGEDFSEDVARHGDLCQLEGYLAGMAHNPCPDLDQAALDAGERPVGNLFG
jgi:hypothetical protein